MAEALVAYLHETPLAGLMLVVTLGYLLGRVSWRGIVVGPACGTVVVGLILGHFLGLSLDALYGQHVPDVTVGLFGFSLFIYSVGFEAGPRFFASVRSSSGWRFMLIGALVNIIATGLVVSLGRALDLDASTAAGVLAGSLTSAPTYAAASEIAPDPTRLSVSFALAYPVGLVVLVLVVQTLPHVMRRPLVTGSLRPRDSQPPLRSAWVPEHGTPELTRSVRVVRDDIDGHTLRELELTQRSGCVISAIHRGDQVLIPRADTALGQVGQNVLR